MIDPDMWKFMKEFTVFTIFMVLMYFVIVALGVSALAFVDYIRN